MYGINSLTFAIGTPVGILAVYRYFRPEFGPKIKVPFESIIEIEIDRRDVSVVFRDINNEICKEVITRCDEKGITILKDLQDNL